MISTPHKQQGTAAIYLVFLLVPLFGAVFFALEGTRYIQKQNRLADASEAAALAITMANRENKTSYDRDLATTYVQSYVRDIMDTPELSVSVKKGEDIVGKVRKPFFQYKVNAKTKHKSWFSSLLIPSFSSTESVVNNAIARNYPEIAGDKYVDIVFVSDFSGSMAERWDSGKSKIDVLKSAVLKIGREVLAENDDEDKNRIGFVPFNMRVQRYVNGKNLCVTQLSYKAYLPGHNARYYTPYEQVNWKKYALELNDKKFRNCWYDSRHCGDVSQNDLRTIYSISNRTNNIHPDPYKYVDIDKTVKNVFIDKIYNTKLHPKADYYKNNYLWSKYSCNADFHTIAMTENINELNAIKKMKAFGGTSVYQGIIQGAQLLQQEKNKYVTQKEKEAYKNRIKMLLILSDGVESPYTETFKELVEKGLCQKIKNEFSDGDVPLYMAVLGIKFDASKQRAFQRCVGTDNIVDVKNVDDLIIKIKDMIKKGTQSEGITKLHYRHLN
ncbi:MAG: VWA domain-containing protein [Moritella sp.]|uniref:pilus assembly protein n=1 Tax=Moritella sp. TaxID=78556 RepID=UPI001D2C92FA|nr:pilus assembly protein TadG-related protein [Moritella sp.]NQZ51363.1 VWA domain-containing protein [Moritella sp.]